MNYYFAHMRVLAPIVFLLIATVAFSQPRSNKQTQWWIGFEGGISTTFPSFSESQSVIQRATISGEKEYDSPGKITFAGGVMMGVEFIDGFSVALHPSVHNYMLQYSTMYDWAGDDGSTTEIDFNNTLRMTYFELPLIFRYDLDPGSGPSMSGSSGVRIYPFFQAGGVYGRLVRSLKEVQISGFDRSGAGDQPFTNTSVSRDAKDLLIPSNFFLLAGGGVAFVLGNARLGLEINYRHGMNVITNRSNRYSDDIFISGTYDALDDIRLRNVEAMLSFQMPLKFITSKDFKAF